MALSNSVLALRPFTLAPGVEVPSAPDGRTNLPQDWGWSGTKEQSALLRLSTI